MNYEYIIQTEDSQDMHFLLEIQRLEIKLYQVSVLSKYIWQNAAEDDNFVS